MSSLPSTHRRSQGFTLIELLVVISIIAILAGMLLPVIGVVREMARSAQCGKNQSQIFGSLIAYSTSEETGWPDPRPGKIAAITATADGGAAYTAAIMELLAFSQTLPNGLFKCPSSSEGGPSKAVASTKATLSAVGTAWGWAPTSGVGVSYAMDWAAPQETGSARVILADRDSANHGKTVMACFGDAHVSKLKKPTVSVTGVTVTINSAAKISIENPAAKGAAGFENVASNVDVDNIYDDIGDYDAANGGATTDSYLPGQADKRRAFVK
jgi:prepilin-type N-terminal cleavage/methylation domain-containing protein